MKKIEHKKYSKTIQSYDLKSISALKAKNPDLWDCEYVVTEKIHGANLCFAVAKINGEIVVKPASRNQFCGKTFQGAGELIASISEDLKNCYKESSKNLEEDVLYIYGELFGAGVQSGVRYGPAKRYAVFDIRMSDQWYSYDELSREIEKLNRRFKGKYSLEAPHLMGRFKTLPDALTCSNEFDSKMSDEKDNTCEGIVITSNIPAGRLKIKNKNKKFTERKQPRRQSLVMDGELIPIFEKMLARVNKNRFDNVLSHHDKFASPKQIGFFIKEFNQDILSPFTQPPEVDKKTWNHLRSMVNKHAKTIVKDHLSNLPNPTPEQVGDPRPQEPQNAQNTQKPPPVVRNLQKCP